MLGCNQFVTKEMYPSDLETFEELSNQPDVMCRGRRRYRFTGWGSDKQRPSMMKRVFCTRI